MKGSRLALGLSVLLAAILATTGAAAAFVDVYAGSGGACVAAGTTSLVDLDSDYCDGGGSSVLAPVIARAELLVVGARIAGDDVCVVIDDGAQPSLDCRGPLCALIAADCDVLESIVETIVLRAH